MPDDRPLSELTDREIDAAVATEMFGHEMAPQGMGVFLLTVQHYSTSYDACRLVEDEMERRGLFTEFLDALYEVTDFMEFRKMRFTPRQRCEAALAVVRAAKGGAK